MSVKSTLSKIEIPDQPVPLVEKAYRKLKSAILSNELVPGTRMLEEAVASYLEMSRTPVREAIMRLQDEGLVECKPRRGMEVLPVSSADMEEIYEVLTALELVGIKRLAAKGLAPVDADRLELAITAMDKALEVGELTVWAKADQLFHSLLLEFAGNSRVVQIANKMADQAHRVRMLTLTMRPLPTASNKDHRDLVAALKVGDTDLAVYIHRGHRERSGALLVELLKKLEQIN